MNRPYLGLWVLLVVALAIVATLSFCPKVAADLHLKTAEFAETLFAVPPTAAPAQAGQGRAARAAAPGAWHRPPSLKTDTASKTILFIGDSMLEGLSPRLAAYAKRNGHTLVSVIWYSSSTEVWGSTTKLKDYIAQFHPDYVMVCLGANELFVPDIAKRRQRYLNAMLSQIGRLPYIWIGPPNWKPDTGINQMLQSTLAPGSFFLSNGQHFDRAADGAHPTRQSASQWMDRVCRWIVTRSAHPIRLEAPAEQSAHCRTLVLQPVR